MRLFALSILIFSGIALQAQNKLAHVDYQKVVELLAVKDSVTNKLQDMQKEMQNVLLSMQNQLQQAQNQYYTKRDSMSAFMRQTQEESIQQQAQQLQQRQQQFEQKLQTYQMQLTNPLFKKVEEAIAEIAKEKGYTYVIDLSTAVYAGGTDLTDLVIKKLGLENVKLPEQQVLPSNPAAGGQMGAPGQGY